jgi:DNA-3-methyladenine glycosylase II
VILLGYNVSMPIASPDELQKAADHLAANDAALAPIISRTGTAMLTPHTDYYGALVNSIIGQQLSVKAAAAIKKRFRELYGGSFPPPQDVLDTSEEALRATGFSRAKVAYIRDLAQHIVEGRISFDNFPDLSNEDILNVLIDVKGIGEWTVHMFLMFCMGRLDVLPVGDLGIRSGMRKLYGFDDLPTPAQVREVAEANRWHPYESAASWYVWRSLDANFETL